MAYVVARHGQFATIDGVERPCGYLKQTDTVRLVSRAEHNPDPALFGWDDTWRVWLAEVPAGQCERLVEIRSYARYLGHRCDVDSVSDDGSAELIYADWNGAWAKNNGFEQTDPGTFRKTVPVRELHDYHEEQLDLLFDAWRARTFTRPAEEAS